MGDGQVGGASWKNWKRGEGGSSWKYMGGYPLSGTCLKPDIPDVSFMGNGGLGNCTWGDTPYRPGLRIMVGWRGVTHNERVLTSPCMMWAVNVPDSSSRVLLSGSLTIRNFEELFKLSLRPGQSLYSGLIGLRKSSSLFLKKKANRWNFIQLRFADMFARSPSQYVHYTVFQIFLVVNRKTGWKTEQNIVPPS